MNAGALGAMELTSVAKGLEATDRLLKRAPVELLVSRVICPGKYFTIFAGSVEDVRSAWEAGIALAGDYLADQLYLTNPHPSILAALTRTNGVTKVKALGVVESFTMCSILAAADAAVKEALVELLEVRLSVMMAGKSFVSFTGEHAAVARAVDVAGGVLRTHGLLLAAVIIPHPCKEMSMFLL